MMFEDRMRKVMWQVLPHLQQAGVQQLVYAYSGSGDSGCFEEVAVYPEVAKWSSLKDEMVTVITSSSRYDVDTKRWVNEISDVEMTIPDAMTQVAESFLYSYHAGWENNEGGNGNITINVEEMTISLDHTDNVMEEITEDKTIVYEGKP